MKYMGCQVGLCLVPPHLATHRRLRAGPGVASVDRAAPASLTRAGVLHARGRPASASGLPHVWEPSGRRLLEQFGDGRGGRAVDIGCGVMGWLRLLSEWVGPEGEVVGTDIDDAMLAAAKAFVADEGLSNVVLVNDDLFETHLEAASFDVVHSRFEVTPLARGEEQMATYCRLARPGGIVALEDWD
jgi:SAM-dependent methyltransferase